MNRKSSPHRRVKRFKEGGFEVRYTYEPSEEAEERLLRAYEMIFFEDGEWAPEFRAGGKKHDSG